MFRNSFLSNNSQTNNMLDDYKNDIMHQRNEIYQLAMSATTTVLENGKKKTKIGGVSFHTMTSVISYEGGRENFVAGDENDQDDDEEDVSDYDEGEQRDSDDDDSSEQIEINPEDFDTLTTKNTEYNSNPSNFKSADPDQLKKPIDLLSENIFHQPDVIPSQNGRACIAISSINGSNAHCVDKPSMNGTGLLPHQQSNLKPLSLLSTAKHSTLTVSDNSKLKPLAIKGVSGLQSLVTDSTDSVPFCQKIDLLSATENGPGARENGLSDQFRSTPVKELSEASSSSSCSSEIVDSTSANGPLVPERKSRSREPNSVKVVGQKSVDERLKHLAVDLESQRKTPKRPAPPPPPIAALNGNMNPSETARTSHARSKSLNLSIKSNIENGHKLELCQKPSRRNTSTQKSMGYESDCDHGSIDEHSGSRGRFASIRKFLRMSDQQGQMAPEKKFRSLRRFPSPFAKTRIDLAEMRNLFHTAEKCNAESEIACDSDVIVTDITEIHSAGNTLKRTNNRRQTTGEDELTTETSPPNVVASIVTNNIATKETPITIINDLNKSTSQPCLYSFAPLEIHHGGTKCEVKDENYKGKRLVEMYDKMISEDVATLAEVAERFPDLSQTWKRHMSHVVNSADLKFNNFVVLSNIPLIVTEPVAVYPGAVKLEQEYLNLPMPKVIVMMNPLKYANIFSSTAKRTKLTFALPVITEFQDYVPSNLLKRHSNEINSKGDDNVLCKISVLPNVRFVTLKQLRDVHKRGTKVHPTLALDDAKICFTLIQLVTCLKYLQSQGIEEVGSDMDAFLLMFPNQARMPKLCVCFEAIGSPEQGKNGCPQTNSRLSLCHCAMKALYSLCNVETSIPDMVHSQKAPPKFFARSAFSDTFQLVVDELMTCKAQSLTLAKSYLEHTFWVVNHSLSQRRKNSSTCFSDELGAKTWLDGERASQVSNLLKLMIQQSDNVDVVEEYRVQFLLHSTPKNLLEASRRTNFERFDIIV